MWFRDLVLVYRTEYILPCIYRDRVYRTEYILPSYIETEFLRSTLKLEHYSIKWKQVFPNIIVQAYQQVTGNLQPARHSPGRVCGAPRTPCRPAAGSPGIDQCYAVRCEAESTAWADRAF